MAKLQLRRVDRVVIGARHDELAQLHQPLLRQRVGLQEWIDAGDAYHLAGQDLEGFEHAARGLLGCVQEFDARLVGGGFLILLIGEHHAHGGIGAAEGDAGTGLADIAGTGKGTADHGS